MKSIKQLAAAVLLSSSLGAGVLADWPQWRGPDRTDISKETGLLKQWPAGGPKLDWIYKDGGLGYAGFAVVGETLYTMGARGDTEMLIALNVKDGSQKWAVPIGALLTNGWGDGPRGTPTVDGEHIYTLSGQGNLICAKASDGTTVWKASMRDLGGKTPGWGYTESPLVDGDKVVCTPGGAKGAVAAFDKKTGKVLWQSADFTEGAQYSSIIAVDHDGKRQFIQRTMAKVVGLDPSSGAVLWVTDFPGKTAVIPTPIYHSGNVYVAAGYGVGCKMVNIGSGNKVTEVYQNDVIINHHGGVVLVGEHLYGYSDKAGWVCQDFKSGKQVWAEKKALGKGAITFADGKLYLLGESDGQVVIIDASPEGWKEHGRFTLTPQTKNRNPKGKVWTHPVIANGKMYLRDQELIFSFDVKGK
ncbi:PQQ-binding-like beta-propeller repeat protein [Humisphaera borealis]|uniref:PQQ-like beta-propeller repeat protein n=1 Tax=Humisphaera borealis TaxID=2807512 RepID=A0A7M2WS02_9BACT|nr:PQQ-binding-like beta-propeller repeat protein [Humisphaera borealis]QOV88297.1 PQQ-like beta-propeller repeat protein [Humisphaera borealis]